MPDAAFQIVSASSASSARSRAGTGRGGGRGRQRRFQNAELAGIAERLPENFSAFSARSAFQTGSAPSASPARSRAGMERGEGRGRQRRFQTPSSPRSRSVFPKISRRSLRARRFKSSPRPLLPPRAPERAWSAERAEAARDDFKRRARRDRGAFSRKFLGVLCALGVSNRPPRPLRPPRAPEPAWSAERAEAETI